MNVNELWAVPSGESSYLEATPIIAVAVTSLFLRKITRTRKMRNIAIAVKPESNYRVGIVNMKYHEYG